MCERFRLVKMNRAKQFDVVKKAVVGVLHGGKPEGKTTARIDVRSEIQ